MRYIDLKVISSDIVHVKGLGLNPVPITSGSVNDIFCRFEFSSHWDSYNVKTAVFTGSGQTRSVIIENGSAVIPWECISLPGGELRVGVVGTSGSDENDKDYAIFTSEEICIGTVVYGANVDTEASGDPSPSLAEQLLLKFEQVEKGENDRIENENGRIENELMRIENESARELAIRGFDSKIVEFENRINMLPSELDGTENNLVCFDENGKLSDSNLSLNSLVKTNDLNTHKSQSADTESGVHGIRLNNGILQIKLNDVWANYLGSSGNASILPSKEIDTNFKNNSWEDIAIVARYGDPSKYWKLGDYKTVNIPCYEFKFTDMKNITFFNRDRFLDFVNFKEGSYSVTIFYDLAKGLIPQISGPNGFYIEDTENYTQFNCVKSYDSTTASYVYNSYISNITITRKIMTVPVQIIGFNHDYVCSPLTYGKSKAGLTLMLGCTKGYYGNKVGVYNGNIPYCSVSLLDNHIISPNSLDNTSKITETGAVWSGSQFRNHLSNHLDLFLPDVITKNAVSVNKLTSKKFSAKNFYREYITTQDKYFLLSEYEIYGEQIVTKAIEGEQYQFFKNGNSKLIFTPELADAVAGNATEKHTNSRFWLRSVVSKYTDPYIPSTNFYDMTSGYKSNPDYTNNGLNKRSNSLLMSYNKDTGIYNYLTGGAHSNSVPAYVAPCFCL